LKPKLEKSLENFPILKEISQPSIILKRRANSVQIINLEINDPELFEIVSYQKGKERSDFVKRALKVGAVALRDSIISIDYLYNV
jgi:hypothetical protein